VKGFVKKINDKRMEMAFLAVVTVTAARAPYRAISASTACTPQNPDSDSINIAGSSSQRC